jgi:hypothetical protein
MESKHAQTCVHSSNKASQANLEKTTRLPSLESSSFVRWANRKRDTLENIISDYIVGVTAWRDGREGLIHVHKVLSKLVKRHPKILTGIINDIGNTHTEFKALKSEVETEVCKHIQDHLDSIAGPLYSLLNLTEIGYQKLINSLS